MYASSYRAVSCNNISNSTSACRINVWDDPDGITSTRTVYIAHSTATTGNLMKILGCEGKKEWNAEVVRTGESSCDFLYFLIISSSMVDTFSLPRDGERIFPTPPRPVEKIYNQEAQWWQIDDPQELVRVLAFVGWQMASLPRVTEKSSGPDSGPDSSLASTEGWRKFPTPPRPVDC